MASVPWFTVVSVFLLLMTGPLNTMLTKVVFEITSVGYYGELKKFHKPWFTTLQMFLGMAPAILVHFCQVFVQTHRRMSEQRRALLEKPDSVDTRRPAKKLPFWKSALYVAFPACLDMTGTTVSYVGLLYNSASVFTMMRGSIIVFSALLSIVFLHRKMNRQNWLGIVLCVVAVTLVGYANLMSHDEKSKTNSPALVAFGMVMIVLSQIIQSLQLVTEEKFMKSINIPPFLVVGMEGIWGTLIMIFIALPIIYYIPGNDSGSLENTLDSVVLYENSSEMQDLMGIYVASIFLTNVSGVLVTKYLSSVHRTMISAMQTAVVWVVGLFTYYAMDPNMSFAEPWTFWSSVQLVGFMMLVLGQLVYAEVFGVPGFTPPTRKPEIVNAEKLATLKSPISIRAMVPDNH
ncbi:conserved hypothetical protein [Perkinsus marinus ATCC 50983]|uniref:EamA domain-containing protein n=1 Tax=Perkinsus marinus (strain ATCC 50983 / TXsc) TaxID=423536 RepID=C5KA08_PERM5|nr:conserved hypothetical protein [Perkinsus marinus ATCC 50983]EER18685.1 conserved hypothetical protein [Perkinsus marinus ATCC 50983]|eukprot:XP_002786889.1 conserved hypothetical protein [Perkinsus marinus ATCC 50983]